MLTGLKGWRDVKDDRQAVLVVGYGRSMQATVLQLKVQTNLKVLGASTFEEAFLLAKKQKPGLVIVQEKLANGSGVTFCKEIKSHPDLKDLFVLLQTDEPSLSDNDSVSLLPWIDGYLPNPESTKLFPFIFQSYLKAKRLKDTLKLQQLETEAIVSSIDEGVIVLDMDGYVKFMNRAAEQLIGYPSEKARGTFIEKIFRLYDPLLEKFGVDFYNDILAYLNIQESVSYKWLVKKSGKKLPIEYKVSFVSLKSENSTAILLTFHDLNEKKFQERLRRESEKKYQLLAETTSDIVFLYDLDVGVLYLNRAGKEISGYSDTELQWLRPSDVIAPEFLPDMEKRLEQRRQGVSEVFHYRTEFISKEGKYIPVEVSSTLLNQNGRASTILAVANVLDRLRKPTFFTDDLQESSFTPDTKEMGTWEWDVESGKIILSKRTKEIFGLRSEENVSSLKSLLECVNPCDIKILADASQQILDKKKAIEFQYRIETRDANVRWIRCFARPIIQGSGKVTRVVGTVLDVTLQRMREGDNLSILGSEFAA